MISLNMAPLASTSSSTIASYGVSSVQSFNRLYTLLQHPDGLFQDQVSPSAVLDELGRFRVWSGNIGALQEGPASLDYRLRDASHVREQVMRLLKDLNFALQEASSIASGERTQGEGASSDHDLDLEFTSEGTSLISDSDSETTSLQHESPPTTEIQELFRSVIEAITSLFKLSIAIRNPAPRDRYVKSATIVPYDNSYDIAHVWEKFPYARRTPWLITRLGKAITLCRHYLRYREKHHEKLAHVPRRAEMKDLPREELPVEHGIESERQASRSTLSSMSGTAIQSETEASTYIAPGSNAIEDLSDKGSVTSYATSVGENDPGHMRVPPPPEESANEMPFECPYCFTIQTVRDSNSWK